MEAFKPENIGKTVDKMQKKVMERDGNNYIISPINSNPIHIDTYRRIFDRLIKPGDTILNAGAGFAFDPTEVVNPLNQSVLEACEGKGATLLTVDIEHGNLLSHQDLKEATGAQHIEMAQADALNLPLADASVAGIVSSNLFNDPTNENKDLGTQANKLLTEAWRVLRPGGFLILSSFGYFVEGKDAQGKPLYNNDLTAETILTLDDLEKLLLEQGFTNITDLEPDPFFDQKMRQLPLPHAQGIYEEAGGFIAYKPRN